MSLNAKPANKLARSLFFIVFVGGLLFMASFIISYIFNHYLSFKYFNGARFTILEIAGIIAFVYVLAFGIRFGFKSSQPVINRFSNQNRNEEEEDCHEIENKLKSNIDMLSANEKEQLKRKLAEICGTHKLD
ncbi:MAG: hypothetical protein Kapaf2KO_07160 [Candidatus Kapaibacteriales bacterium]